MGFEAWHGSRYGACGFESGYGDVDVAWFSFGRGDAEEFAQQAWREGYLPTLCRVMVAGDRYSLFDASADLTDEDVQQDFIACLKQKGVSDYWISSILGSMENYEFTAFDPSGGGTDSDKVAECIQEMGYIGWMERESYYDDPQNFGLFDPGNRVTIVEEIKLCPERGMEMEQVDEYTYECGCSDTCGVYRICEHCDQVLEYDDEEDVWEYPCHCDMGMRKNPMTTVEDLEMFIDNSPSLPDDWEAFKIAAEEYYPASLKDPEKFLEERPERAGYRIMHGRNFSYVGPKGRLLKVYAEQIQPVEGNIFYFDKLKGLAVAPKYTDFKIPIFVGYVEPWIMDQGLYDEAIDYEDEFYEPDEDDIGEMFFQLRDGNHRTIATLISGEPYAWVQISANTYEDYRKWVDAGRPETWPSANVEILEYLDDNLF